MKMNRNFSPFYSVPVALILFSLNLLAQDPPDGPPDIVPTPFQGGTPFALGTVIIPPFNAADPGSTILGNGQFVQLEVVTSLPDIDGIQWKKDGQVIEGATGPSLTVTNVSELTAGTYQVDIPVNNSTESSNEVQFEVLPLAQIDDVFTSWTNRFFSFEELDDPELSSDIADPDDDGITNVAEYFFGLNPRERSQEPTIDILDSTSARLSFSYPRTNARTDLFLNIQGSNTLDEWFSLPTNQMSVIPIDDSKELVEMSVDWPSSLPSNPRFLRLAIEQAGQ